MSAINGFWLGAAALIALAGCAVIEPQEDGYAHLQLVPSGSLEGPRDLTDLNRGESSPSDIWAP
jgi:hypothetical protein